MGQHTNSPNDINRPEQAGSMQLSGVEIGDLSGSLGFVLRICQLMAFDRFYRGGEILPITAGEFSTLWTIGLNPGIRQGQLGAAMFIKPAHMTKLIRRLEDQGYVQRVIPEDDRRAVCLSLTTSGRELIQNFRDTFFARHNAEAEGLSSQELQEFLRLLRKYAGIEPRA